MLWGLQLVPPRGTCYTSLQYCDSASECIAGSLHVLPGHDTMRLTAAAHRVGQRFRSNRRREQQNNHQQQQQCQARTSQAFTPAVAGRQADAAANHQRTVMTHPQATGGCPSQQQLGPETDTVQLIAKRDLFQYMATQTCEK